MGKRLQSRAAWPFWGGDSVFSHYSLEFSPLSLSQFLREIKIKQGLISSLRSIVFVNFEVYFLHNTSSYPLRFTVYVQEHSRSAKGK